jgi:mxaA protein
MRRARLALLLLAASWLALVGAGRAEAPRTRLLAERGFGFFVGDVARASVEIEANDDLRLLAASLPRPGAMSDTLDLRDIEARELPAEKGRRRWRVDLAYQIFYVALDARELQIPGFPLRFSDGVETRTVTTPAWRVGVSPLREVLPRKRENPADYLQPDSLAPRVDETTPAGWTAALGGTTLLALALVARDRGWPPFHRRRARAFAQAARRIARRMRRGEDEAARQAALLELHRAVDEAAGRRVFAEDVDAFLSAHVEYEPQRAGLERFFAASRAAFFGAPNGPGEPFPLADLRELATRLAACERSGP